MPAESSPSMIANSNKIANSPSSPSIRMTALPATMGELLKLDMLGVVIFDHTDPTTRIGHTVMAEVAAGIAKPHTDMQ